MDLGDAVQENSDAVSDEAGNEIVVPPARCRDMLRENFLQTVTFWLLFWSFGMGVSFLGPTLLDLGCQTGTVFGTMSWVFFAQSLFILLGSAAGGFLVERFSKHGLLLLSCSVFTLTMAAIPFCSGLFSLALDLSVMGFFMGIIDTTANISMIELYGKRVGPFLQALHFFYGFGAFLSPIIVEPFLLNVDCTAFIDPNSTQVAARSLSRLSAHRGRSASSLATAVATSKVKDAFWIISGIQTPVLLLIYVVVARERIEKEQSQRNREVYEIRDKSVQPPEEDKGILDSSAASVQRIITFASAACLILFLLDGLQATFNGYIYSFAIKSVKNMEATFAAYVDALFWGTFALGRLLSIGLSTKISSSRMLAGNLAGCLLGILILMAFYGSKASLICGVSVLGLFLSSVYPTVMSFVEYHFEMTPPVTTSMVLSAAFGEMLLPVVVGHAVEASGAFSFLIVALVLALLSLLVLGILYAMSLAFRTGSEVLLPFKSALRKIVTRKRSDTEVLLNYERLS